MKKQKNKGFTLIELIIVTIVLGVLAAVAVPRYMGSISNTEAAAEASTIAALRIAVEQYADQKYLEEGRYSYPSNPFELVDVDGYCGACELGMEDGSWKYLSDGDLHTITHQRRDNSLWYWTYDTADRSNADSDDRGYNIGTNNLVNGDQVDVTQQESLKN